MKLVHLFLSLFVFICLQNCSSNEWISLFDGKTLDGWQINESPGSWSIEDGAIKTNGKRSHLFYMGEVNNHNFKNFELMADVKTLPGSNSKIYFHTAYQDSGWPALGYESQVLNSNPPTEPGQYMEHKMTGSLYAIKNTWKAVAYDTEWFKYHIIVQGKTIRVIINDELITEYTEPENPYRPADKSERLISSGTYALQGHDPGSTVYYKNIKVKILPNDLKTPGIANNDSEFEQKIVQLSNDNFPLIDTHVHLKNGLAMNAALENARKYGFTYGMALNCGLQMGFETNDSLENYLASYKKPASTFIAMQAEGREWLEIFAKETIAKFDYVFTDAMTWTNDNGKRMRLWIPEETEIGDPQNFMDQLVNQIESIVNNEPIDIYVNATYIPDELADHYDDLWTEKRMDRVIDALVKNNVAMEINDRRKIPSATFIKRAKQAGVKFTFGTNNAGGDDLGRLEYCIAMIKECDLKTSDIWIPLKNN